MVIEENINEKIFTCRADIVLHERMIKNHPERISTNANYRAHIRWLHARVAELEKMRESLWIKPESLNGL